VQGVSKVTKVHLPPQIIGLAILQDVIYSKQTQIDDEALGKEQLMFFSA